MSLRRFFLGCGFGGAIVVAACGGPTSLDARSYDRSCTKASDCVLVTTDACCGCANAAINQSDLARYQADLRAASKNCSTCLAKPCAPEMAVCIDSVCAPGYAPEAGVPDAGADAATEAGSDGGGDASSSDASSDGATDASADASADAQDAAGE